MQWLVSNQQARRNMIYGELIFANPLATNKIVFGKRRKKSKGNKSGTNISNAKTVSVQMGAERKSVISFCLILMVKI